MLKPILILSSSFVLAACSGSSSSLLGSVGASTQNISGMVSAGPVAVGLVAAYSMNANGSLGALLGSATTDATGKYSLTITATSGPVVLVAANGSYNEEAPSGAGSVRNVNLLNAKMRTVLATTTDGQQVGITPVTEIATQAAVASIASNSAVSATAIIKKSNATVATAMGLNDITLPPANPNVLASQATSVQAAQYAVILAAISQMAVRASSAAVPPTSINSLDVAQALATSFTYNGNFTTTVSIGSSPVDIPVPNANLIMCFLLTTRFVNYAKT